MPVTTEDGASAVVSNVEYVFGGSNDGTTVTNAVWGRQPIQKQVILQIRDANRASKHRGSDRKRRRLRHWWHGWPEAVQHRRKPSPS
jgi:hypothetical protein